VGPDYINQIIEVQKKTVSSAYILYMDELFLVRSITSPAVFMFSAKFLTERPETKLLFLQNIYIRACGVPQCKCV